MLSGRSEPLPLLSMSAPSDSPSSACARLLSLAVHELRTPASVVGGYLRMLQRDSESPLSDRQRKMIDEAEKSCARMVALIAEMSEVSKFDSGAVSLGREPLDLFALVGDVANGVHESGERDVRLEVRGDGSGASVLGDPARLKHAFDAVFRAVLREQPSACVVVAERRIAKDGGGANSAVVVVAPDARVQAASATTARRRLEAGMLPSIGMETRGDPSHVAGHIEDDIAERHVTDVRWHPNCPAWATYAEACA